MTTRIQRYLHDWFPDQVMLQTEARQNHVLLQVFLVGKLQLVAMTLYDTEADGVTPNLDHEIGCEVFTPTGGITWNDLRGSIELNAGIPATNL